MRWGLSACIQLILENAPPESIGLLLTLVDGALMTVSVGTSVFVFQGGTVFGYAGSYLTVTGLTFSSA